MGVPVEPRDVAGALRNSLSAVIRRLRQVHPSGALSLPEEAALSRLDREGPATSADLAKRERITPQSMGTTLAALESRGLVVRRPDPNDGRRSVMSLTRAGRELVLRKRGLLTELIARALSANFTAAELVRLRDAAVLLDRLAEKL